MTATATTFPLYKLFVLGLIALTAVSILSYVGFTVATIFATAERSQASHESKVLISAIGELERSYFSIEHGITEDEARKRGFVLPGKVSYAEPVTESVLSINTTAR